MGLKGANTVKFVQLGAADHYGVTIDDVEVYDSECDPELSVAASNKETACKFNILLNDVRIGTGSSCVKQSFTGPNSVSVTLQPI